MKRWYLFLLAFSLPKVATAEPVAWPASVTTAMHFEVQWKGKHAGFYEVSFSRENDKLVVLQTEELALSKLLITAKATSSAEARFSGPQLESLNSHITIESTLGDKTADLAVVRTPRGFQATSEGKTTALSTNAWPLMFWDKQLLSRGDLFEMTQGKSVLITAKPMGSELVEAEGRKMPCDRFDVVAEIDGDKSAASLWYEPTGRLCAMVRAGDFGSIRYVRQQAVVR